MFNKKTLLSLLVLSSLTLTACGTTGEDSNLDNTTPPIEEQDDTGTNDGDTDQTTDNATNDTQDTTQIPSGDVSDSISVKPEETFDIFLEKYPDAKITHIKLNRKMDSFIYEVEGFEGDTEIELKIDPIDGAIITEDRDREKDRDRDHHENEAITREQVEKASDLIDKTLVDAGEGATLKEWKIQVDDGVTKLEIELGEPGFGDVEYKYNLDTGELIEKDR